MKIKYF